MTYNGDGEVALTEVQTLTLVLSLVQWLFFLRNMCTFEGRIHCHAAFQDLTSTISPLDYAEQVPKKVHEAQAAAGAKGSLSHLNA